MRGCRSAGVPWVLGAAVMVVVAACSAGAPSVGAAASSGAADGPAVPCTAATLSVTAGPTEGAAGTVHAPLRFSNTGSRPCVTRGFPRVSYVTAREGAQVGRAAERDGAPDGMVTLAPGEVASANLAIAQVDNFARGVCQPTPVWGLRVYPPGQPAPIFVPMNGTGCAGNPPDPQLRISTIKQGPS